MIGVLAMGKDLDGRKRREAQNAPDRELQEMLAARVRESLQEARKTSRDIPAFRRPFRLTPDMVVAGRLTSEGRAKNGWHMQA